MKIEGGERRIELIARLVEAEIPVMGHVGLTPQSHPRAGRLSRSGKNREAARQLERDARAVESAGAFAVVLESMPRELAARITDKLRIPTIGIGAGSGLRRPGSRVARSARPDPGPPAEIRADNMRISAARFRAPSASYCEDVRSGNFPSDAESFHSTAELRDYLRAPALANSAPERYCRQRTAVNMNLTNGADPHEPGRFSLFSTISTPGPIVAPLTPARRSPTQQFTRRPRHQLSSRCATRSRTSCGAEWIWLERWHGRAPDKYPSSAGISESRIVRAPLGRNRKRSARLHRFANTRGSATRHCITRRWLALRRRNRFGKCCSIS